MKPVVYIGKEGVTPAAVRAAEEALSGRELMKIKVLEGSPLPARESGNALAASIDGAVVVQLIGRIVVLYRSHPDKPEIRLPS